MRYSVVITSTRSRVEIGSISGNERKSKPVVQLSKEGELIGIFPSISQAEKSTGIRHIYEAAHGERNTAGGFVWQLEGDYYNGKSS